MRTDKIIEVGLLNDEVFRKRFKQVRRVFSPNGLTPTIPAACGMGGGLLQR
jgi:hypothetical protein